MKGVGGREGGIRRAESVRGWVEGVGRAGGVESGNGSGSGRGYSFT